MERDDDIGSGQDLGTGAGGFDGDIGGSHSGGDAGDAGTNTTGQEVRGEPDVSSEDAERSTLPEQYDETPEDLQLGKRQAAGQDPEAGPGTPSAPGRTDGT